MSTEEKKLVFISHIAEEKEIALALKQVIDKYFLGMMEVFVSSDSAESIQPGTPWLDRIVNALKRSAVEIVIASPKSVARPWINFEAGAGFVRDIPVIPLCHSGMTPGGLPMPLGALQAAIATDDAQLDSVVPVLAEALGSKLPAIDWSGFTDVVRQFRDMSSTTSQRWPVDVDVQGGMQRDTQGDNICLEVTNVGDNVIPPHQLVIYNRDENFTWLLRSKIGGEQLPDQKREHLLRVNDDVIRPRAQVRALEFPSEDRYTLQLRLDHSDKSLYENDQIGEACAAIIRQAIADGHLGGSSRHWSELNSG